MPSQSYKNNSYGVFTSSRIVDSMLSRRDAQRFQFRTQSNFEYTTKKCSPDEVGENFWMIHNTGNKKTTYMDMPAMSADSLADRSCTKYAFDYNKKPSFDQEATNFMAAGMKARYGTVQYRRPPQVDWSMYKKSRYTETFKDISRDDRIFARAAENTVSDADTKRVLNGRGGSQITSSWQQDTHNHIAVALPPGKTASYPAQKQTCALTAEKTYSGNIFRSGYTEDTVKAKGRLEAGIKERQRLVAKLASSAPLL